MNATEPAVNARAQALVREYVLLSAASALIPAPVLCTTAVTAVHLELLVELSRLYRVPFNPKTMEVLTIGAAGGVATDCVIKLPFVQRFVAAFAPIVIPVWFIGGSIIAGTFTHLLGHAIIRHYETGGVYANFDWAEFGREVARKAGLGRAVASVAPAPSHPLLAR